MLGYFFNFFIYTNGTLKTIKKTFRRKNKINKFVQKKCEVGSATVVIS